MKTSNIHLFRREDGSFPPLAGGDPALAERPAEVLQAERRQLQQQYTAARAATREASFEQQKLAAAAVAAGKLGDEESDEYKAADAAHTAYQEALATEASLEAQLNTATDWAAIGLNGPQGDGGGLGAVATDKLALSAGDIVLRSTTYAELQAKNAFVAAPGVKSIDCVLKHSGATEEERSASGRALARALRAGVTAASLVTGSDDSQAGALIEPQKLPGIERIPAKDPRLIDYITIGETTSDSVKFVVEKGGVNNAAETAEATAIAGTSGTAPISEIELATETFDVVDIQHAIAATKRALGDAGQLRTLIEQFLSTGLDDRLDGQIASGNGQGENIRGIYNTPGTALVEWRKAQAGNTATPEVKVAAIYRAILTVRKARHRPNAIGMSIDDWGEIVLTHLNQQPVANQVGSAGSYGEGGFMLPGAPVDVVNQRLWGLPVIVSDDFETGLPVVGDYRKAAAWIREGASILATDTHEDFFLRSMVAILAKVRLAFGVIAPAAFCVADIS